MTLVPIKPAPFNAESDISELVHDVTPTAEFYVRSNFPVPRLADYRLVVDGLVQRSLSLSLDELRGLDSRTLVTTMECAGNNRTSLAPLPSGEPWQGGAISTGRWTGVPLASVLARAGLRDGVVEILAEGADRGKPKDGPPDIPFARSLPLEKALHADTLLAWEMNGEPLPPDHGAPIRLVVPSWYGMGGVKWVIRLTAIDAPFKGYYQRNRYIYDLADGSEPAPVREMLVKSTIVSIGSGVVRGRAWSGSGEVARVEIAIDGGDAWASAEVEPPSGPYAWQRWSFALPRLDPGRHALRCRASDTAGNVQPAIGKWNKYGYGSNAVQVTVLP